jgi:hypothetical protein
MVCKEKARSEEHQAEEDGSISEKAVKLKADDDSRAASNATSYTRSLC